MFRERYQLFDMMRTFPSIPSPLLLVLTLNVKNMVTAMAFQITNIGNQYQSEKPFICKHVLSMTNSMTPVNTNNNIDDEGKYFGIIDRRYILGKTLSSLMLVPSVKLGASSGETVGPGDCVVFDWFGFTIGYFGRPFEAKGGP